MRRRIWITFAIIIALATIAILIDLPQAPNWKLGTFHKEFKIHEGLDLKGGTQLTYKADLKSSRNNSKDMANLRNVFEQRVNGLGVAESNIQTSGKDKIIIELPGIKNIEDAKNKIGATYELLFMEEAPNGTVLNDYYTSQPYPGTWTPTKLTGRQLKSAMVNIDQQSLSADPIVSMRFNREGTTLFSEITKKNLNKRVAIVLDGKIVSAPTVQSEITSGDAQITGLDSQDEAQKLSNRLNEGILPVPAKLIGQNTIGPTLGSESVKKSLIAGAIGLLLIAIFMISFYKFPGLLAVIALTFYSLFALAIFKYIPVTLTLAGIAGFILSIGMAVDANILIFERMKEEIHSGKPINKSLEEGFNRAWNSVRDSNASSLITCFILYILTTGFVRGFALTLAIGIVVSLFTAITVTRTFLRLFTNTRYEKLLSRM
ncbi:MAG: protein translocase subunit SecD [bacterium]|nr:protein translocase subunit SecD [bacterium]